MFSTQMLYVLFLAVREQVMLDCCQPSNCVAGCELPPAVVTERDWAKEQRKLAAPPGLGGRGRGRGGGYSTGGRGMAPGGRGGFAARSVFSYSAATLLLLCVLIILAATA